jgi:hypothetical protein
VQGQYYFYQDHLYGPNGSTGEYVHGNGKYGHLYSPKGYTNFYIHEDYIYGPRGYTNHYLHGTSNDKYKYIYGSDEIPFLND